MDHGFMLIKIVKDHAISCMRDIKFNDRFEVRGNNSIQKEIHILYFGDYDPSGVDMNSNIEKASLVFRRVF
jgi:hypothetical protein